MKNARGFTIVEVLVVVIIITILATIGTLTFAGYQSQSRDKKSEANAIVIAESLERYYDINGEYPSIPAVTSVTGAQLKTLLNVTDASAFVMPNAPTNTTNSLKAPSGSVAPGTIAYEANIGSGTSSTSCTNINDGCDSFKLKWKSEAEVSDVPNEIVSRHEGRQGTLQAPQDPIMTAAVSGGSLVGTVTHANPGNPICTLGTPQYKILSSTSSITPDWSDTYWSTATSKTITTPLLATKYYFYAIARCISTDGVGIENPKVATDDFFFNEAIITASWSGTNAVGTVTSKSAPASICESGTVASYNIKSKVDVIGTEGQWLPTTDSWTATSTLQITGLPSPKKVSFKATVRCNPTSPASIGTFIIQTNTDFVVSAPSTPVVAQAAAGPPTAQWTWQPISCPFGTTTVYTGSFGGNYPYFPAINQVTSPYSLSGVANDGYTREFGVKASCGAPSGKILSSARGASAAVTQSIQELSPGAGRFFINDYDGSGNRIRGAATIHSDSSGYCPTGTNRYVTVQFAHNKTGSDNNQWNTYRSGEYWPGGNLLTQTGQILYATASADSSTAGANSNLEFRADVYCHNPVTGARSAQRLIDRYGILRIYGQNEGGTIKPYKYRVWCNGQSINESSLGSEWLYCEQVDSYSGVPRGAVRARGEAAAWGAGF